MGVCKTWLKLRGLEKMWRCRPKDLDLECQFALKVLREKSIEMWNKDKKACPKEGESNPMDSNGHTEVAAVMEKELL